MKRMITSIKINPEVWKKAKLFCVQHEVNLADFIEELIEKALKSEKK